MRSEISTDAGSESHEVYLGLGANIGDREKNIREAVRLIGERVGEILRQSSLIETAPWGFQSDNRFLNAVVCCITRLTPRQLLKTTQQIERDLGKTAAHATQRSNNAQCTMHNAQCTMHNAQTSSPKLQPLAAVPGASAPGVATTPGASAPGVATTPGASAPGVPARSSTHHASLFKDRPIDIDILLYDNLTIDEPDLKIPHPLMYERDFVMIPLNEIRITKTNQLDNEKTTDYHFCGRTDT